MRSIDIPFVHCVKPSAMTSKIPVDVSSGGTHPAAMTGTPADSSSGGQHPAGQQRMFHALRLAHSLTLLFLDFKHSLTLKFTCRYFARDPTLAKRTSREAWRESRELRALELEDWRMHSLWTMTNLALRCKPSRQMPPVESTLPSPSSFCSSDDILLLDDPPRVGCVPEVSPELSGWPFRGC